MTNEVKTKKTFFSAGIIAFVVFLSKITAVFRDMLFAKYLGTGIVAEAFYSAYRLPNTFRRIFGEGAISNVFVPFFSIKVKEDKVKACLFAGRVFILLTIMLLILIIMMEIFMPQIVHLINPGFIKDKEKFDLTIKLSRISFPYLMCISITALFGAILNSIGSFWQFTSISMLLNIVFMIGIIFFRNSFINTGYCLCCVLILAGIFQILFVAYFCIKKSLFPIFYTKNNLLNVYNEQNKLDIKLFLKKFIPAVGSSGILQINIFIDGIFASFFPGVLSRMYYADRIGQFTLSLIGYSLSVAILPVLSLAFAKKEIDNIKHIQTKSVNIALFFTIPAMFLLETISLQIISLIYQRGAFTAQDSRVVANMLSIYAISLPFSILLKILFVFFYSQKDTSTPLKIGIFSLIANIILNFILMKVIGQYCVLVATTISTFLTFCLTIIVLQKGNNLYFNIKELKISAKVVLISILSCIVIPLLLKDKVLIFTLLCFIAFLHLILCFIFKVIDLKNIASMFSVFKGRK